MSKKISVLIATYNRRDYLNEAIKSVLSQSYKNYEIIIINDCSKDDTIEFINKNYGENANISFYTNKENMGISYNHKLGMEYATGEYVIFLDDDDKFINDTYFEKAIKLFDQHPSLALVTGANTVYNTMNNTCTEKKFPYGEVVDNKEFFLKFASPEFQKPAISSAIIKKQALIPEGSMKIDMLNDVAIFLYALLYGPMGFVNELVIQYLVHGENMSFDCNTDFIVENLEEKYHVYKVAKNKFNFTKKELKIWLEEQAGVTVVYFINGTQPSKANFKKVAKWVHKRLGLKKYLMYNKLYKKAQGKEKTI